MAPAKEPLDILKASLGKQVEVQLRHERELRGILLGYDIHVNMVLKGVQEVSHPAGAAAPLTRRVDMLYVRGDGVVLVTPVVS